MKHLCLVIPNLLPPPEIARELCAGLQLPALEKILARGNAGTTPARTLEDWLCTAFGTRSIAPVSAAADGVEVGTEYWLCADPVSLQLQRAEMLVLPDVTSSRAEADALCAGLNEHFEGMGIHFVAPHPQRWYVQLATEPQLTTSPLRQVAWGDAKFHQPRGTDALQWQRIATEVQMLLYAHPVNREREARGELLVNNLWFWGGGRATNLNTALDAIGGDSGLAGAFAHVAGVQQILTMQEMLEGKYENGLWVSEAPCAALQRGDLYQWRMALERIENTLVDPVLKALQAGQLQRLELLALQENELHRYTVTRGDMWKLWRAVRPLARYAL